MLRRILTFTLSIILVAMTTFFFMQNSTSLTASNRFDFEGEAQVIIGFNDGFSHIDLPVHITPERSFGLINAVTTKLPAPALQALTNHPAIAFIELDQSIHLSRPPFLTNEERPSWGLTRIFQSESRPYEVWNDTLGDGVRVAVFDTGIEGAHEDLVVVGGVNTINDHPYDTDLNGHGTHVAGIIAGLHNDLGIMGVAPNVELFSVVVFNEDGVGSTSNIVAGIEWVISQGIPLMNMSLQSEGYSFALERAIEEAHALGHIIIAAAGNNGEDGGPDTMSFPARYDGVIAVGATTEDNTIASFSSYGPTLDLVAPGASIRSTFTSNSYSTQSGTSMAAPFVTGVVALMLSLNPALTHQEILSHLTQATEDLGFDETMQGAGLLRADFLFASFSTGETVVTHTITVIQPEHGIINPKGSFLVIEGSNINFSIEANEGYQVQQLFVNGESVGAVSDFTLQNITQAYTIEAQMEKRNFMIQFDVNHGDPITALSVRYDEAIPPLPEAMRLGHAFEGWYLDASLVTPMALTTMPAQDLTLYAKYRVNEYRITFDVNEGEPLDSLTVLFDEPIPELGQTSKLGHTFEGWYLDASLVTPMALTTMPAQDVTLYAKFSVNEYRITFDVNEGEPLDSLTVMFDEPIPELGQTSKLGHTFEGWYLDETFTTPMSFTTMPAQDVTLYAKFSVNDYPLIIWQEGQIVFQKDIPYMTDLQSIDLPLPTRLGFTFLDYDPVMPSTMPAQTLEVEEVWRINRYTINFVIDDENTILREITFDEPIGLPVPDFKQGYDFMGWFEGDILFDLEFMPARDLELTAVFQPRTPPKMTIFEETTTFGYGSSLTISLIEGVEVMLDGVRLETYTVINTPGRYQVSLQDEHFHVTYDIVIQSRIQLRHIVYGVLGLSITITSFMLLNPLKKVT